MVELKDGFAQFRMPVRPEYMQGAKAMQGGLIVALADETIAHAMMTQLTPEEGLTTIELKSNFLAGVSDGELIATATVFKKGQSLIIGDCLVTDNKEKNTEKVSRELAMVETSKEGILMLDRELATRIFVAGSPLDPAAYNVAP